MTCTSRYSPRSSDLSISFYENRPTGEIMSRVLNDTEHMQRIFVDGLEEIITAGLTLIGIMIMLFMLNWKLALLALVPIPSWWWERRSSPNVSMDTIA